MNQKKNQLLQNTNKIELVFFSQVTRRKKLFKFYLNFNKNKKNIKIKNTNHIEWII